MFLFLFASIILIGSPGAGKGTFAQTYQANHPEIENLSIGEWLRKEMQLKTPVGLQVIEEMQKESFIQNGCLVSDELVQRLVKEKIDEFTVMGKSFILDGFPRSISQVHFLESYLNSDDIDYVLLTIKPEEAKERMLNRIACRNCGFIYNEKTMPPVLEGKCDFCSGDLTKRAADNAEFIEERFKGFDQITKKVIDFYQEKGVLLVLDGSLPHKEIVNLYEVSKNQ